MKLYIALKFLLILLTIIAGVLYGQIPNNSFEDWESADPPAKLTLEQREALRFGEYIPNKTNTGLLPGWSLETLEPVIPQSGHFVRLSSGLYENKIFWCEVRLNGSAALVFRNCVFAGYDPDAIADGTGGEQPGRDGTQGFQCWGNDITQWEMSDCVIDPSVWFNASLNPPGGPRTGNMSYKLRSVTGIRGGSGTVRRCEITNVHDGISIIQSAVDDADSSFMTIQGNWIHGMIFYRGEGHHQPEGTHSDGIQFHTGRNITIRGNRIGGAYDPFGYSQDPSYNSGDDIYNAGIMLQQEVSSEDNVRLENILIEKNIFEGGRSGGYNINHSSKFTTTFTTTFIRDNWFILRSPAHYVIRPAAWSFCYSDNRIARWDLNGFSVTDAGPITYSNGKPPAQ